MALEIPAAQVPLVRKYFQLLNSIADNSAPGQNLRIDRDVLSLLTDEQLAGFKRLVAYLHKEDSNNERNEVAIRNSSNLKKLYTQENNPDIFLQMFGHNNEDQMEGLFEMFDEICGILRRVELNTPEAISQFAPLISVFPTLAANYGTLQDLGIDNVNTLATLFSDLGVDESRATAEQFGEFLTRYCSLQGNELREFQDKYLEPRRTRSRLLEETGLSPNNLRTMANYLNFRSVSGGRRRKTRKQRKNRK